MTAPHRYIENQFVKISRNTLHRMPLLVPDRSGVLVSELEYIIAREAMKWDIVILAMCIHPFGYRAVIFDPKMQRSHFLKSVNQCISLAVKRLRPHEESLWSNRKPGNAPILDMESLKEEILEVCLDPVRKGFVHRIEDWELPNIGPAEWGKLLSFDDPRQDPSELKKRSAEHSPGMLLNVNYATKIMELKEGLMDEIRRFESIEKKRRSSVFKKLDRFNSAAYSVMAKEHKRYFERTGFYTKCLKCLRKLVSTMRTFYLKYREAIAEFDWDKWPLFPKGTLKLRESFQVPCEIDDDDAFLFRC